MTNRSAFVVSALVLAAACGKDKASDKAGGGSAAPSAAPAARSGDRGPSPIAMKDGADGLKAFFEASHAACNAKDFAKGRSLTQAIVPTRDHLTKIFKDDVPADKIDGIAVQYSQLPPSDEKVSCIFTPGQGRTEIRVHASTVEDLAAYKQGTPAFDEFPGGAQKLAQSVLKPGTTFYEVEVAEPGKDAGTKYHMFFWDGAQWRMLGPAWRQFQ